MTRQTMRSLRAILILFGVIYSAPASTTAEKCSVISLLSNGICPNLACGSETMTVTFLKSDLQKLKLDVNNIHLIDRTCVGFQDDKSVSIKSPTKVGMCQTYVIVNGTHAIYKNNVFLKPDPSVVIYREDYMVNFSCIYPLTMEVSLGTVLKPILSIRTLSITGSGQFEVTMALFKDPAYTIPRQDGDVLSTKDKLYVGVIFTKGDTDTFNLVLKNCFATPTNNFHDKLKYYIIKDGCQNKQDSTIHVPANGIATYGQFSVQAFQFIGGYRQIFLHCQVRLCENSGSCIPDCTAGGSSGGGSDDEIDYITLGVGVKEPEHLCPDLQCGASYINVTFPRSDLIDSNVDISKLKTNGGKCHDLYEDGNIVSVGWPLGVGVCGTTMSTNSTHAIYKNSISLPPIPSQIIYRTEFYVDVSCVYPLDLNVSLHKVLNPIISTIIISIENVGQFEVTMAAFKDQAYQEPYKANDITLSTKSRLFVGVFISKGDTSQFVLVMQQCYATPTQNPLDPINYGIIVDSCAKEDDGTIEIYSNGMSSEGKFSILMFKFVNHSHVFLHCKVYLCSKSPACAPVCPKTKSRSAAPQGTTFTFGPIRIDKSVENEEPSDNSPTTTKSPTDNTAANTSPIMTTSKGNADKRTCYGLLTFVAILLVTLVL